MPTPPQIKPPEITSPQQRQRTRRKPDDRGPAAQMTCRGPKWAACAFHRCLTQALPNGFGKMTSTITARSRANLRLSEAFAALFPLWLHHGCPKRQAMHHIVHLESKPRGFNGAIGLMRPGGRVTFNVPIRTVCVHTPSSNPWSLTCGIGSGHQCSTPQAPAKANEWQPSRPSSSGLKYPSRFSNRCGLKTARPSPDRAFENAPFSPPCTSTTFLASKYLIWNWHCSELLRTAQAHPHGCHKVRALIDAQAQVHVEAAPYRIRPNHSRGHGAPRHAARRRIHSP